MLKELEFSKNQKGFGLVFTNPLSGIRSLTGIFDTYEEADQTGRELYSKGDAIRPEVVTWDRQNYEKYEWVFRHK